MITLLKLKDPKLYELVKTKRKDRTGPPMSVNYIFWNKRIIFISELGRVGVTRLLLWQEYLKRISRRLWLLSFCELLDIQINLKEPDHGLKHNPGELAGN